MSSVKVFNCPTCKAPLAFDPESGTWKCNYCFNAFSKEQLDAQVTPETEAETQEAPLDPEKEALQKYHCSNCGAEVISDGNTLATFCLYCKSPTIIKSRFKGEFKPKFVIPFKISKETVKANYLKRVRKNIFAPTAFKADEELEKFTGLYAPFWLFDCTTSGRLEAEGTQVSSWVVGDNQYTKTKFFRVVREGTVVYEKIPVDAATKLDDEAMHMVEPYNYEDLKDFSMQYMSGFLAEKYDVDEEACQKTMEERVKEYFSSRLRSTISNYNTVSVKSMDAQFEDAQSAYALFPVYVLMNKFKDKEYFFLVNGQTGKVVGNTPTDRKKQLLFFLASFGIALVLTLLGGALIG